MPAKSAISMSVLLPGNRLPQPGEAHRGSDAGAAAVRRDAGRAVEPEPPGDVGRAADPDPGSGPHPRLVDRPSVLEDQRAVGEDVRAVVAPVDTEGLHEVGRSA